MRDRSGHQGRILDITATGLVLETSEGRVTLPGRVYNDQPILVLPGNHGG